MALTDQRSDTKADDRLPVPTVLRRSLYAAFLIAAALSVPRLGEYGPLPMTVILDVWIVLFLVVCIAKGRLRAPGLLLILGLFLFTRGLLALANQAPLEDFLQAYRWVLYLIALTVALGRTWGPIRPLIRVTWALLGLAAAKATLTFYVLGPGERPGLLLENNFELALFCGLVAVLYQHMSARARVLTLLTLACITVLAGSRSGAVAFLLLVIYAISQAQVRNLFGRYVLAWAVPVAVLLPLWIFTERARGVAVIDRLNFLEVFRFETRDWDLLSWAFGTMPITPLNAQSCAQLSYYQPLFSSLADGSCYSVIMHAFILRVIFDAGIFGLILAHGAAWFTLRKGGVTFALTACLILIALANGASVSGINNPYVFLPMLLAVATVGATAQPGPPSKPARLSRLR